MHSRYSSVPICLESLRNGSFLSMSFSRPVMIIDDLTSEKPHRDDRRGDKSRRRTKGTEQRTAHYDRDSRRSQVVCLFATLHIHTLYCTRHLHKLPIHQLYHYYYNMYIIISSFLLPFPAKAEADLVVESRAAAAAATRRIIVKPSSSTY